MATIRIKKRVSDLVEKFNRGEITEKDYYTEIQKVHYQDEDKFWRLVVEQEASEEVKRLVVKAKEVLEAMEENDLIDYSIIIQDFVRLYQDNCGVDVGLQTYFIDCISDCTLDWVKYEDEGLYETLSQLEENWLWEHVFPVVVATYVQENDLVAKALESVQVF